jgi:HEAT repeat protein
MHIMKRLRQAACRGAVPAAVIAGCVWAGAVLAQHAPPDPVEALSRDLKIKVLDPQNQEALKFRERSLQRDVQELRSINELRRALQLQAAWSDDQAGAVAEVQVIDRKYRELIADRFRQQLTRMMKSGDPLAEMAAADLLNEIGVSIRGSSEQGAGGVTRRLAPDLVDLLKSDDVRVRNAAARALGKINPDPVLAVPALGQLLRTPRDEPLHGTAATILGDMILVVSQIVAKSTTSDIVAKRGDLIRTVELVIPRLGPGITDPDPDVRRQALEGVRRAAAALGGLVGEIKSEDFPPLGRAWSPDEQAIVEEERQKVQAERQELMPIAVSLRGLAPQLRQALLDPDEQVRLAAGKALEEIGNSHMRLLRRALSVPAAPPQTRAPQGRIPDALKPRAKITRRPKEGRTLPAEALVSARLLVALEQRQPPQTPLQADGPLQQLILDELPALEAQLQNPDVRVRLSMMNIIEALDGDAYRAAPILIRALADPDRFVRWQAARILGKTKPLVAAVPGLTRLISDQDLGVRTAAATTIGYYGDLARDALPAVIYAVNHGDAESREIAIRTVEDFTADVAAPAVPALAEAVFDRDVRVRRAAAEALGKMGAVARSAEGALRRALQEPKQDPEVLRAVSEAVLNILQKSGDK